MLCGKFIFFCWINYFCSKLKIYSSSSDGPASNEPIKRFVPTVGPQNNVTLVTWLFIFFLLMPSYS